MTLEITIIGAGGIGCAVGYALLRTGCRVTFVDAHADKVVAGNRRGVQLFGERPIAAPFISFADWRPSSDSIHLLCTKCYDTPAVLDRLPSATPIVPIQNGFDPALDARGHTVEGIASFVSECVPDRPTTRITRNGDLHLGGRGGQVPAWLSKLSWHLQAARIFRVCPVGDVRPFKRTKLMYNAAISPIAAAAGIDNGQLLSNPRARRLFFGLLRENYAVLKSTGWPLGTIGPFHPDTVMKILGRPWVARLLAFAFTPTLRGTYCSMSGDLPKGQTEIDYYNGRLVEWAEEFGSPCPLNRRAVEVVKRMETERISPSVSMLEEFNTSLAPR